MDERFVRVGAHHVGKELRAAVCTFFVVASGTLVFRDLKQSRTSKDINLVTTFVNDLSSAIPLNTSR
jgi:hypothetical protein